MFNLIHNTLVNSWGTVNASVDLHNYVNHAGIANAASRVTITDSSVAWDITNSFDLSDPTSKQVEFSIVLRQVTLCDTATLRIQDEAQTVDFATSVIALSSEWQRFSITTVPTSTTPNLAFNIDPSTAALDAAFEFADPYVIVDSENITLVEPEFNYTEKDKKVEARHRTKSGKEYVYKFGDYNRFSFGVNYVNSEFKSVVNSYWNNNAELLFMEENAIQVFSARLSNKELPIGKPIKPYTDSFKGKIELETY